MYFVSRRLSVALSRSSETTYGHWRIRSWPVSDWFSTMAGSRCPRTPIRVGPCGSPGLWIGRGLPPHGKTVGAPYSKLGATGPPITLRSTLSLVSSLGRRPCGPWLVESNAQEVRGPSLPKKTGTDPTPRGGAGGTPRAFVPRGPAGATLGIPSPSTCG